MLATILQGACLGSRPRLTMQIWVNGASDVDVALARREGAASRLMAAGARSAASGALFASWPWYVGQ